MLKKLFLLLFPLTFFTSGFASEPVAVIWKADDLSSAGFEESLLKQAGFAVQSVNTDALHSRLNAMDFDLLVTLDSYYPVALTSQLQRYLSRGGQLFASRGNPLLCPVYQINGMNHSLYEEADGEKISLERIKWDFQHNDPESVVKVSRGADGVSISFTVASYVYSGFTFPSIPSGKDWMLSFEIKSEDSDMVCLELQEKGGSRWKKMINMSEQWSTVTSHFAEFFPYVPKDNKATYPNPDNLNCFCLGYTYSMQGKGTKNIRIRNLALMPAAVPSRMVAEVPRFVSNRLLPSKWFGQKSISIKPHQINNLPLYGPPITFIAPTDANNAFRLISFITQDAEKGLVRQLSDNLSIMARGISISNPTLLFTATEGGIHVRPRARVFNTSSGQKRVSIKAGIYLPDEDVPCLRISSEDLIQPRQKCLLPSGKDAMALSKAQEAMLFNSKYNFKLEADGIIYPLAYEVNIRQTLEEICDFLVAQASDDNKLHGNFFIDSRGMRTLLVAYDIFKKRQYLDTALKWGKMIVSLQRDDGGYRMGYGISKTRGEECYVADGGEIAIAIAMLASCSKDDDKSMFLKSLDSYMAYRESFRCPEGGIGVGWCLSDYSKRPVPAGQLPKAMKIYAPELNTYTIGCTLAAASIHADIKQSAELAGKVNADAKWLAARVKSLSGPTAESYVYAFMKEKSPERKNEYKQYLKSLFRDRIVSLDGKNWWNVRAALNLDVAALYLKYVEPGDLQLRAAMLNAISKMFGKEGIPALIQLPQRTHDQWISICYGTLGLADYISLCSPN